MKSGQKVSLRSKLIPRAQAFHSLIKGNHYTLLFLLLLTCLIPTDLFGFGPGDRVKVISASTVRTGPSTSYKSIFTNQVGQLGVIITPAVYDGSSYYWCSNQWDNGIWGYSAVQYLNAIAPAAPNLISPGNNNSPGSIITNSPIAMIWNSNLGATNYGLYIRDTSISSSSPLVYSNDYVGIITNLALQGFTPGHSFRWNMEASDSAGFSTNSILFYFQYIPAVTGIITSNATSVTSTSAVFSACFYPNGTPVSAYFQYGTTTQYGTPFGEVNITTGLNNQWSFWVTNNNLSPNTTYHYQVVVINNGGLGQSYFGNDASFITLGNTPTAPSGLTAANATSGILLSWQDNSSNENGFYIQRRQGSSYAYFSVGVNQTSYTDTSVSQSIQYCYSISATNSSGSSAFTSEQCTTYTIPGSAPVAVIAGNKTPVTGTSQYIGTYSTGTGTLNYSWSSSDGQQYAVANPQFQFNSPGKYSIYLTVTDSAHRTGNASIQINVQASNSGTTTFVVAIGADPVVLSTGNYIQNRVDLQMPGKGFPFEFRRFYNSKYSDQTGLPLGFGWTFNYNEHLVNTGTNVLVIQGDGSTWTFFPTNSAYVGEPGIFDSLAHNPDSTWALTNKSQTVTRFDTNGHLLSITDKNANTLTCSYVGGVLSQIIDTAGRTNYFSANTLGCISTITDPIGRLIKFVYDARTNLIAVVVANNQTNQYFYDSNHQMTNACDPKGTFYIYNEYDQTNFFVIRQHDAYTNWSYFAYDFTSQITYVTNALGKVSIHSFDDRLLETNVIDESNNRQVFLYDTNRNRTYIKDKNGNETHYAYDALGNVTNKTDAFSNVTSIAYNSLNNPTIRVDALTNITTFGYDSRDNLTSTTNALNFVSRVQYDSSGLPTILTDARTFGTTNQYDSQGNLTNVFDAHGFATQFVYDGVGRKIYQIDALTHVNSFAYDNNDNLLFTTNALNLVNAFTYDANNNRTSSRNPRNAITTNIFDLKDRLIAMLAPLNQTNGTIYDALDRKIATFDSLGNQTGYTYDDVGNLTAITNALKQVTRFTYDPQGNQTSVIDPTTHYVTNFFDALNRKIVTINVSISTNSTAYDALGRVTATTNANNQVTQFFYDSIGRLTNVVDAAFQHVSFTYDENGNRTHITDPNGHTWTNKFDELNRLFEQDDPLTNKMVFRYDPVGNLTNKVTANVDSINYSYDALNRLFTIAYPSGPPVTFGYDEVGNRTNMVDSLGTTTWQFDLLNRLSNVTDPYGQTVTNGFDANGNRTSVAYPGNKVVNYGFDSLNRMMALTNWLNGVVTYGYDSRGNLIAATNANSTTTAYAYDVADRLVGLTNAAPDASVIAAYALTLDGIGNHKQATHNQPLFPILPNQTNNYTYDSANRLTTNDGLTVTHNANGDLTGIGTNSYTYDFEDRLVQLALTNTLSSFTYDGLGDRLARTINGQAQHFVIDRMGALTQVLVETDTNNSPFAYYVYGHGLAERISIGGTVATYHFNIQGSTVALTDLGGNITDSCAYDSFGVLANSDGDSPQPFRYLGRYGIVDDGTGLYYARARYFNPQLGRFLTKDTATSKDNDGQSLNRFVYALNNPLRFRDTSGLVATEGNFLSILNLSLRNFIVTEQVEVLLPPRTANSTPAVYTGFGGLGPIDALSLATLAIPGLEEVGGEVLITEYVEGTAADAAVDLPRGGTYLLRDPVTGDVMRTGRSNDLLRRAAEHGRDSELRDLQFEAVHRTDVYAEQRGLEQLLHETYNPPLDYINPISPTNPNLQTYLDAAQEFLQGNGL
jgi:RHS repeat-associated protein